MILRGDEELSREQIRRILTGEPLEHPSEEQVEEVGIEEMTRYERRIDSLLMEVERRAAEAPRIYPFRVEDRLVSRVAVVGGLAYRFLLWLSLKNAPFRDDRLEEVEEPFDDLSRAALVVLVGPDGDAKLFAQRYAVEDGTDELRPDGFPEAIAWLRGHLKLREGQGSAHQAENEDGERDEGGDGDAQAETSTGDEEARDLPLRTYNDGGVDVVAWRHFQDGRAGFPVLLAQCTVQEKWRGKTRDVSLELWRSWIDFPTPPQKLLVIPFAIPENASWWRDRNRLAGMILGAGRMGQSGRAGIGLVRGVGKGWGGSASCLTTAATRRSPIFGSWATKVGSTARHERSPSRRCQFSARPKTPQRGRRRPGGNGVPSIDLRHAVSSPDCLPGLTSISPTVRSP